MRGTIILSSLFLLITLSATGCSKTYPESNSRQIGELCDDKYGCQSGLVCEDGICRVVCDTDSQCNTNQKCQGNRCVNTSGRDETNTDETNTDETNTDKQESTDTTGLNYPEGNGLANVAGRSTDNQYSVRVLGGSLTGGSSNQNNTVHVNEGTWR